MTKSSLFSKFAMDNDKEEAGVWVNFGDGIRFKVRRLKSRKSQEVRKELDKPFTTEIRRGALPDDVAQDLLVRQIAGGVVAAWEGVTDEQGNDVAYTPDNAYAILKKLPELVDELLGLSLNKDSFKASDDQAAEGN